MENNIPKFTFCITSKNNLRYLKHAIFYIKKNTVREHDILIFIDKNDDNTSEWCKQNQVKFILNPNKELLGIGNAYNLLVKESKTKFVVIYHTDMILGEGFDQELYKHWKPHTVVSATRIEPPLHPEDPSKIVKNFGLWPEKNTPEGFDVESFNKFVKNNKSGKVTKGIFAPWLISKEDFIEVGGHDPIMKSHSEDRELFNRFLLRGYNLIKSWDAFVYHLTCRGGQFEHATTTQDLQTKSPQWIKLAESQTKEFIKKWGSPPLYDSYQYPIIAPLYKKSIKINNSTPQLEQILEPWFNGGQDIIVEIDGNNFNQQDYQYIQQLNDIIKDNGEIGEFQLGNLYIKVNSLKEYQDELIFIPNTNS